VCLQVLALKSDMSRSQNARSNAGPFLVSAGSVQPVRSDGHGFEPGSGWIGHRSQVGRSSRGQQENTVAVADVQAVHHLDPQAEGK
jgi:hypothetical protein